MATTVSVATPAPCVDTAANPPSPLPSSSSPQNDTAKFAAALADAAAEAAATPFVFRSKFPDIPNIHSHLPLHTYCFQNISRFSDRPCLINGTTGDAFTFAETHRLCRQAAAGLRSLGVGRGDAIMILLHNTHEYVFSFMGASMLGAMTTAANPFCTPTEIHKQFKASGAKLIITHSAYVDKLVGGPFPEIGRGDDHLTVVLIDDDDDKDGRSPDGCLRFSQAILRHDLDLDDEQKKEPDHEAFFDPDSPVSLPFSSGTTGLPKGVMLTHRSLITSIAQQVDGDNPNLHLTPEDVVLCVLPLFHIFSLNSVLLCSLRTGSAVLLMKKFEINTLLSLVQTHRVSVAPVVPPLVLALAKNPLVDKYDLSSVRIVLSGAAPLGKDLELALRNRLPQAIFGQGYGMTEAGPVLSMCSAFAKHPLPAKSGSCGTVVRNAELKVIDPETGVSLHHNQPGEICIRGQQIMKGYLNDPEATFRTIDMEGWLHTGDIGYVDDDEEVYIIDRVKELIKFKGFQVPPAELESLLLTHPDIADAAVVPQKDEAAGEVPVAFVVKANSCLELTEDAVKEFVSKQVVFYKRLHKVYFIHAIPKSAAGKILRKDLKGKLVTCSLSSP